LDLFPVSVLTTSTLEQLSELRPKRRFDQRRFRMNVIVDTPTRGFVENEWVGRSLAIGDDVVAYSLVVYFSSEGEAREGERNELPPELQAQMDEINQLNIGVPEFFDLKQPILSSPA
jgi:hypothetical protein